MSADRSAISLSLTGRLFRGLVGPTAGLAVLLGLGGAWAIHSVVEALNDRLLGASARAIAETLSVENDEITLDVPPWALGMLENTARDNIYYNVHEAGRLITGYPNLPPPQATLGDQQTAFRYGHYRGQRVRIAAQARRLPRIENLVIVQVAETLEARRALSRYMLLRLAVLELALLALASFLVPIGVRWGLAPLMKLRSTMDARYISDFTPLPLTGVPRELQDLVRTFNALLARLDRAVEGMRRFTADASHQMRTPLSILRTHIDVLKSSRLQGRDATASLADIETATERLQRLLTQLLALARAEGAEPCGLALRETDLGAVVRAVAEEHALGALRAGIDLHFLPEGPHPLPVRADEILVSELVGNLIDNAVRYSTSGGTVTVRTSSTEDYVVVEIEDEGPGIPPQERGKVFTRFYRLERDHGQPGSGLGLSIVRVLADILGAEVILAGGSGNKGLLVRVVFRRLLS